MTNVLSQFKFQFQSNTVRAITIDGEIWFVAADVCAVLGLTNITMALKALDEDEAALSNVEVRSENGVVQKREVNIINESGLYALILRSRKPEAKRFRKWVTSEVLPSIRKTGQYGGNSLPGALSLPNFDNPAMAARAWAEQYERRQIAEAQRDEAIRTKAQIGSKREATAMATASIAIRKVDKLEDELGRGKQFKSVKAIPWLLDVFEPSKGMYSQIGKHLKKLSLSNAYPVEKISVPDYKDGINAYHSDIIEMFSRELTKHPDMFAKFRHLR